MLDSPRVEDLRRRVQKDPASIAFAQLAEELRRAGEYQQAVDTCRAGLAIHPGYLSARVTLGRALIELDSLDEAQVELDLVLGGAPENLAAIRGLAEIYHRRGALTEALKQYRAALALARNDPDLERTVTELARAIEPRRPAPVFDGLSFEQMANEFLKHSPPPPAPAESPFAAAPSWRTEAAPAVTVSSTVPDMVPDMVPDTVSDAVPDPVSDTASNRTSDTVSDPASDAVSDPESDPTAVAPSPFAAVPSPTGAPPAIAVSDMVPDTVSEPASDPAWDTVSDRVSDPVSDLVSDPVSDPRPDTMPVAASDTVPNNVPVASTPDTGTAHPQDQTPPEEAPSSIEHETVASAVVLSVDPPAAASGLPSPFDAFWASAGQVPPSPLDAFWASAGRVPPSPSPSSEVAPASAEGWPPSADAAAPPVEDATRAHAQATVAVLDRWLDAIHVARAQRSA